MRFPQVDRLRLAVLISGSGTTLRNLLAQMDEGRLSAEIPLVISNTPTAKGLDFALERSIATQVIERSSVESREAFSEAVFSACRAASPHFVVMGGFLKHVLIPPDFENRVLNIHPGLIPAFCGKGMYGHHVHEAVLDYGAKVSGCTVHFVDNQYDHGPIILQRVVPVESGDTPDSLAGRVFEAECEAYPDALRLLASGRVEMVGRRVIS
ncbi:MAG: phosphoribosylglycinamide formyltransferase [Planctomycetia bacterium]|nr:phosphoribosylglycinamide formyltransferase [Planctomycetia bacterium]